MEAMKTILAVTALAGLACAAAGAWAQGREGIAQLKDVHGNVLVSRQTGLASGAEAARLVDGMRVITTANAEVVVVYDNGCEVRLKENQRFQVETGKPCAALVASVQSILVPPAGVMAAGGSVGAGAFWSVLPALGGAAIGVEILQRDRQKQPVSPS